MHKNHLKKTFQLEGYILDRIEYQSKQVLLYCYVRHRTMTYKGERSNRVNESRIRYLPHMMLEDKKVVLVIEQRRFYFPKHKSKRWELLPDMGKRKQTTNTFRLNTLRELQRDNYSGTGYKRQRSHMFPMHLLDGLSIENKWTKPIKKIGMDGKGAGRNKVIHNLTNLDDRKPHLVFPNTNQQELKKN